MSVERCRREAFIIIVSCCWWMKQRSSLVRHKALHRVKINQSVSATPSSLTHANNVYNIYIHIISLPHPSLTPSLSATGGTFSSRNRSQYLSFLCLMRCTRPGTKNKQHSCYGIACACDGVYSSGSSSSSNNTCGARHHQRSVAATQQQPKTRYRRKQPEIKWYTWTIIRKA